MWLSLAVLLIGAEPDAAEAAFKKMEQQVLKCKTLQTQLDLTAVEGEKSILAVKGRVLVAPGDKVRLEMEGTIQGKDGKMDMVSDGKKQRMTSTGRPAQDRDTKKQLGEMMLSSLTRGGVFVTLFSIRPEGDDKEAFDAAKMFPVSDFKLGKKEAVGGVDTQAIEYKLTPKGGMEPAAVTVWVDVKTNLPVKRTVVLQMGKSASALLTESYSKTVADGKIDDKEFELSK